MLYLPTVKLDSVNFSISWSASFRSSKYLQGIISFTIIKEMSIIIHYSFISFLFFCLFISCITTGSRHSGPTEYCQNGMLVYVAYTYVSDVGKPYESASMVLAENWTHPEAGMVFAAEKSVEVFKE
jgi:hypothetical protein